MGDRIIVTDDEPKPAPQVVVVKEPRPKVEVEEVVTERRTTVEKKGD